jgi:hypothetical protein
MVARGSSTLQQFQHSRVDVPTIYPAIVHGNTRNLNHAGKTHLSFMVDLHAGKHTVMGRSQVVCSFSLSDEHLFDCSYLARVIATQEDFGRHAVRPSWLSIQRQSRMQN